MHNALPPLLASRALLVLSLAACGGSGFVTTGDAGAVAPPPSSGCATLCQRMSACASWPDAVCLSACDQAVAQVGMLGESVADACGSCLQQQSCPALASGFGPCAAACPLPASLGSSSGGDAAAGSDSGGGGSGCPRSWGSQYEVACASPDPAGYFCSCYEGGVEGLTFKTINFCTASPADQTSEAELACAWSNLP